jgi:Flp pilus assembly protein TadG
MPTNVSSFLKDQSGASVVLFAMVLFVVVAVTALAITAGDAYSVRTKTQNALDAAVLAGAGAPGDATDAERIAIAESVYASNKSKSDGTNAEITVSSESAANFSVSETMVHGDVTFPMTSPFLGVFGEKSLTIRVSSAAQKSLGSPVCLLGLDPTEEQTISLNGNADVELEECAAMANSSSGSGIRQVGGGRMKAEAIGVTGGVSGSNFSPKPTTGATPIPDPYVSLPEPPIGHCEPSPDLRQATVALRPGTYCGGLDIKPNSVVKLLPGEYIMKDGPLLIQAGSVVTGDQVIIAFLGEGATMYLIGDASLTVTSPIDGPYKNIQFFGDRNVYGKKQENLWMTVIGGSRLSYDGVLYAPSHHVWWTGGAVIEANSPNYTAVAKKLWFEGNAQVRISQRDTRGLSVEASAKLDNGAALFR